MSDKFEALCSVLEKAILTDHMKESLRLIEVAHLYSLDMPSEEVEMAKQTVTERLKKKEN